MLLPSLIIAGTHSGCGKTTVAQGIMAALVARGYTVQPFKVGPDFIDPGHHRGITGRESINLDGWMLSRAYNRELLQRWSQDAGAVVGEGVMGLFDGFSGREEWGSTAQMAKWLDIPVLLVVDARSMARSAAALVQGYTGFDPEVPFAGVVFNRIGSPGHKQILTEAIESVPGVKIYGALPRSEDLEIPSRHLGLVTEEDFSSSGDRAGRLAGWIEEHLDLDGLLESLAKRQSSMCSNGPRHSEIKPPGQEKGFEGSPVRIGVARDQAFCFYYNENLRLLAQAGAEPVFFSPLRDAELPNSLDGLYLGGGYPELHCEQLAANKAMLAAVRGFCESGRPVYAECGGFMYLMRQIFDGQGKAYPMAGIFPFSARMENRFRALGYREVLTLQPSLLGPEGSVLRGHEFHYSGVCDIQAETERIYRLSDRQRPLEMKEGYRKGAVLGSYIHLHWGSCPEAAEHFVQACIDARGENQF